MLSVFHFTPLKHVAILKLGNFHISNYCRKMLFIVLFVILTLIVIYTWLRWNYKYWMRRGIVQLNPILLFGNIKELVLVKRNPYETYNGLYWEYGGDEPALGYYKMRQPALLIRHFSLARKILVDEFQSFSKNDRYFEPSDEIMNNHPSSNEQEDKLDYLRNIGINAMVPARLTKMLPHILSCCNDMIDYLKENNNKYFDANNLARQYTTDTSIKCVYGLHSNSFGTSNSIYRHINEEIFNPPLPRLIPLLVVKFFPKIGNLLKIKLISQSFSDFYLSVVKDSIEYRRKYDIEMIDFLQSLIELNEKDQTLNFTLTEITGHSLTLLLDGFATSGVVACHVLDIITRHPHVQSKLRKEIEEYVQEESDITYENLSSMPYLDAFFCEVLRTRPPFPVIQKICTKDIILEESGKKYPLKIGDRVTIPLLSIHNDPKYFPDPATFQPERFTVDRNHEGYFPYGLGPRTCLGMNFGLIQIKAFIVSILKNFEVVQSKYSDKVEFDRSQHLYLKIKGKIWIKFIVKENESPW